MEAMGFPNGIPGIPDSIFLPENFIFPVFDYDWGRDYDHSEANGVPTNAPPPIRHVIKMLVPRVDADGNELGGVPTVLNDAPLGTYLGWNITAGPGDARLRRPAVPCRPALQLRRRHGAVRQDQGAAARPPGDPRLSLEERYGTHAGYVAAVKKAANNAACRGTCSPARKRRRWRCRREVRGAASPAPAGSERLESLVEAAIASNVCNQPGDGGKCNPAAP